jgi:glycosyltransferase involved in cell wall biosynthesis
MKKNILILDTGKEWGGGTNSLLELLKRVNKKKFSFSVLFYINYQKGNESCIKQEIEKLGIEFLLLEREPTSFLTKIPKEIARILFFFSKKIQKKLIFYVDYQSRIKKDANRISAILIKRKIDLIYMNNQPSSNLEGILASEMTGIPSLQHARIETTLKPYEVKASNRTLSKIICVSEGVKDNFVKNGINESKCVVVHNGISSETKPLVPSREIKAKWGIADTDIVIGTVGSLIKRKRVKDLIEIMHIIATTADYSVKCLIIGEGPERNNLVNLAKKKKLYDKIIFTGFQVDAVWTSLS